MSIFGVDETRSNQNLSPILTRKPENQAGNFGSLVESAGQDDQTSASASSSAQTYRPWALGTVNATYNAAGQVNGGRVDLTSEVKKAADNDFEVSPELAAKLTGDDEGDFIDGLCEITGKTPAQIMTALLNMSASEAAGFAQSLAELTGGSAESFMPMISKLTGHEEGMLQQCLNGQEEEEEEGQETKDQGDTAKSAQAMDYQRTFFQKMNFPSIDVTV